MVVDIYTDGSSSHAGKSTATAGWAFVIPDLLGKMIVRYGHLPTGTNNQGELFGPLYFLYLFHTKKNWTFNIYSDSQYVIKSVTEWRRKWELMDYMDVKNTDLLLPLFELYDKHGNTKLHKVKGHSGNLGNELADEWCGKGKKQEIINITNDVKDIKYIHWDDIPYFTKKEFYD